MANTEEKFEELEIEEIEEEAPEAVATPAPEQSKRRGNPFKVPLLIFGILLFLLLAALIGTWLYKNYWDNGRQETASSGEVDEDAYKAALEEAAKQKEKELQERLVEEYSQGISVGEQQVLDQLRQSIQDGNSVVETLRMLYSDQLVVASGGTYHFIPINDSLKKNDYVAESLVTMSNGELQYVQGGAVTSYKGIDVSKFQGKIDWKKVAEDGVTFAIIRVGYRGYGEKGTMVVDPMARENLQGANDAGIKTGVYYYTQAITEAEAMEEVNAVLEIVAPYRIDCPIVIDVERVSSEGARMNKLDPETRTRIVKTFCDGIAAAGYCPMIYHNLEMGAVLLDIAQLEEYDKWFAYYKNELYYPYAYQVWQYSDKGRVQGISGDVDLNIAFEAIWE